MLKKFSLFGVALCTTCLAFAQVKKEKVPPPPPPPVVAVKPVPPPPPPPAPAKLDGLNEYETFLKRNPDVKNIQWAERNIVRIRLKSGEEEVYHMNKKAEAQQLENKYGKLPVPPPPPPAPKAPKVPAPIED